MIGRARLRALRNDIAVHEVMRDDLGITVYFEAGHWRFQCPLCHQYDTATNPRTNLGRCFRCRRNFNPIDVTIIVRRCTFLEAVEDLEATLRTRRDRQNAAVPDRR